MSTSATPDTAQERRKALMPIDHIEDWETRVERQDAFWDGQIIDRPVVHMAYPKEKPEVPWPVHPSDDVLSMTFASGARDGGGSGDLKTKQYANLEEYWHDTGRVVEEARALALNMVYAGDALPSAWPNLGPEVFSAFFGMELEYTEHTAYGIPNLHDWAEADMLQFSRDNRFWRKLEEMTDALLEGGKGLYYTGYTDLHPGGDCLAAFRDPAALNLDVLMEPEAVKTLNDRVEEVFLDVFDETLDKLQAAGQAITTWPGIVSACRWHVPSNDFSCMISPEMFNEFFLPGIAEECRHAERTVYHLDGPNALRHLDALLSIPELSAIQWVYGAGNGVATDWIDVYQKCQKAGKGLQIMNVTPAQYEELARHLRPEGVWASVLVDGPETAEAVIRMASSWK